MSDKDEHNPNFTTLTRQVASLETDMSWIKKTLGEHKDTLTGFKSRLDRIDNKTWAILAGIITTLIGVIISISR